MPAALRVLIVDDHEVVRRGLADLLDEHADLNCVGKADSAASAVAAVRELRPEVVLLDIRLPDASGLEACRQLKNEFPTIKVLLLSTTVDDQLILEAIAAGADGYLLKEVTGDEIVVGLRKVAAGGAVLDPTITRRVMSRLAQTHAPAPRQSKLDSLSPQELRVLKLVAKGYTNKEVAEALSLSQKTVRNYLVSVFQKLDVSRRTEAVSVFEKQRRETEFCD